MNAQRQFPGLTSLEAAQKLKKLGPNELPSAKPRTTLKIALGTLKEPMFLLLLACSGVYFTLGDFGEAIFLSSAIVVIIAITFIQERRAERTIEALRDLSSPRALVIRDGQSVRIAGREVVPGDLVWVSEGDRIPADGFVVSSGALKLDESLLTGESVPVMKTEWDGRTSLGQAGGDHTPFVFSGTLVVQGTGTVLIEVTGHKTAMGRIGASLVQTVRPQSPLQKETRRMVRIAAFSSLILSIGIAVMWWFRGQDILNGILMGITFAMATIPEEFLVILTVFMALGAWRISKQKVLTRQMNAIEALGSATYLCVDKTGTLTENHMTLTAAWAGKSGIVKIGKSESSMSEALRELIRVSALASARETTEPMDSACVLMAERLGFELPKPTQSFPMVRPLLAVGQAYDFGVVTKGAPEAILKLCGASEAQRAEITAAAELMALQGCRVLGVASTYAKASADKLDQFKFSFVGLLGFHDPVRHGVAEDVLQCHQAGIKVVMITGDYPATALNIAREIGLENSKDVLTGEQLAQMSDAELAASLKTVRVLARMVPEQKLRVVNALRARGEVVAMTGDGVNDAPALKAADIGIAMGLRGTDVAREAAALVVLNDDFTSIVAAVALGRQIYDNLQKAIGYIISIHIPIVGLALVPLLIGVPPILYPVHLVFLQLIIDPVCSLAFEAEPAEAFNMKRPPRQAKSNLFNKTVWGTGGLGGLLVFISVLVVYLTVGKMGKVSEHARAIAFATLIFGNMGLVLTFRSKTEPVWAFLRRPNPMLLWIFLMALCMFGAVFYVPALTKIFYFTAPHWGDLSISLAIAVLSLGGFEIVKAFRRRALQRVR